MTVVVSPCFKMAASEGDPCLPERRIHCSTGKILVGNQEFMSASEALFAYLQQFDGKARSKKQQEAYDLLVARTKIATRRTKFIQNEVKDNLIALRQRKLKQLLHKKKMEESGLKREVEDALSRSADLLERINDDNSPLPCASDIGSMSTDLLLSVNPLDHSRDVIIDEDGKRRHVYSYHTPRSRTRTVDGIPLQPHLSRKAADKSRRSSVDSAIPSTTLKQSKRSSSSNSATHSRHSDPTDILKRLRSRSASPLPSYLRNPIPGSSQPAPDWVYDLDASSGKSVPSWVQSMDASLDESLWARRLAAAGGGRSAPSWIHDAAQSDTTADSLLLNGKRDLSFNKSNLTDSRPGLNFSDLATSGISRYSDKHSFLASQRRDAGPRARSLEDSTADYKLKDGSRKSALSSGFKVYSAVTSSDEQGSGLKKLAAEGSQLTKSLDQYLEKLEAESYSPGKSNKRRSKTGPKCSSMESMSSVNNGRHLLKSDVTGASPIPRDGNIRSGVSILSEEAIFTPARVRFSPLKPATISPAPHRSPSTDIILDGDRPWEQPIGAYKSPVYVDKQQISDALRSEQKTPSPTLTGREQPGSMEALKNMLFRLQAEESSAEQAPDGASVKSMRNPLDLPALEDYNFQGEPGGHSLEKALVHLSRLKNLVQTSQTPSDSVSTVTMATSLTQGSTLTS